MATRVMTEQPAQTLTGLNCEVELYSDRLVIRRNDLFSRLLRGDLTVYPGEIAAVHIYECRFEQHGQLRLDLTDRSRDAIVLKYPCQQHMAAAAIKEAVEAALRRA